MSASTRIAWLDIAKGGSILLVVFLHASIKAEDAGIGNSHIWMINTIFGPIRMPVFFAVSGYLVRSLIRKEWRVVLTKRVWLLIYLFVLWTILHAIYRQGILYGQPPSVVIGTFLNSLITPSSEIWFIHALAIYTVATKGLYKLPRHALLGAALVMTFLSFSGLIQVDEHSHKGLLQYYAFFLIGCLFGEIAVERITSLGVLTLAALAVLYVTLFYGKMELTGLALGMAELAMCITGLLVGCRMAEWISRVPRLPDPLTYLGHNTLAIYLAHPFLLSIMLRLIRRIDGLPYWSSYVVIPGVVVAAIAGSLLLKVVVERVGAGWLYAPPALPGTREPAEARGR
ncbi:acyltransferase family protein [Chthonobacter rhizosphaerae]|uniref:acyltransferase family protein n=1 Tax=Chthonobacter rhizosphaerae TaxID=2735553 RepID=UPI0015EF96D5|nr:acyltransferase family protein [Chthonobacter rhizosphaerae]